MAKSQALDIESIAKDAMDLAEEECPLALLPAPPEHGHCAVPFKGTTYDVYLDPHLSFNSDLSKKTLALNNYQAIAHELGHRKSKAEEFLAHVQHELGMRYDVFKEDYLDAECESTVEDLKIDTNFVSKCEKYSAGFLSNTLRSTIDDAFILRHIDIQRLSYGYKITGIGKMAFIQLLLRMLRRRSIAYKIISDVRTGFENQIPFSMKKYAENMVNQVDYYLQSRVFGDEEINHHIQGLKRKMTNIVDEPTVDETFQEDFHQMFKFTVFSGSLPPKTVLREHSLEEIKTQNRTARKKYSLSESLLSTLAEA